MRRAPARPTAIKGAGVRELLPYLSFAVAVAACAISAWTAIRAGRWRDSDAARELVDRIDDVEDRVSRIETVLTNVVTKADLAEVKGELHTVARQLNNQVVPALDRLEGYFLKQGMERSK